MNTVKRLVVPCLLFFALPLIPHTAHSHERERISVHTINLNPAHKELGPDGLAASLDSIAKILLDGLVSGTRSWDLIGLSEAYCEPRGIFEACTKTPHRCLSHDPDDLGPSIGKEFTTRCLATYLQLNKGRKGTPDANINRQKGSVGFLARGEKFEILGGLVKNKALGGTWFKPSGKRVLGARLRIKSTGHIFPFYTTNVGAGVSRDPKTGASIETKQMQDLISAIKNWWRSGDLTPVVVGTFNLTKDHQCYDLMREDFDEVGRKVDFKGMEQIWIGKKSSFPGSRGRMEVVRHETLRSLQDGHGALPDHAVSYAELLTPGPDVRDLTIGKCEFTDRLALDYNRKVRCDRYELTFSWNCNYLPRFTIMVDGFAYQDPRDHITYVQRLCPASAGTMTVPMHFVVAPDSYARVITVELESPDCSRSIAIELERPSIKITPYLHKGYEYTALGSSGREQFIRGSAEAYQDVQVMEDMFAPEKIEEHWGRRIFVHGKPIGEVNNPRSLIAGFVIRYKLGFVANPVFCTIQSKAVIDPISLSAKVTKYKESAVVERSTMEGFPRKNWIIFDGFTRQDYLDSVSLTFDFEAVDDVGQRPRNRLTFYAKSLLCIVSPEYSELLIDLDSGSIKARIYDSIIKALFTDLVAQLPEHDRTLARQGFTAFKLRIADEVGDTLARIQQDKNAWSAFRKAQRDHYVDIEQEIFHQFASQASFGEAQAMTEPLRESMIRTALSTPVEILSHMALSDLKKSETVHHVMEYLLFKEFDQNSWPP
ncbi:MAG: hypothetical protein JSV55_08030 [Deltaproteobacteria bacterium]|nr:MAG: hypothetical protein JSV55_08030 [Deltaproteobacteria bacterium]